jgi:3-oxoacyl-[acyl-carrier protein] reductase
MSDPSHPLTGRTAIVTGAGRGIGRSIALHLSRLGANVILASRSADQLNSVRNEIQSSGGKAIAIAADVSQEQAAQSVITTARTQFGGIDVLVNNAGHVAVGTIAQLSVADFDALIATNIRSMFLLCRAAWNDLAARKGAIVNISSMSAFDPFEGLGAYGATKSFVNFYTKVLADEGAPLGIRAFAVAPGAVETQMLRGAFPEFPREQALQPDDIADLVAKLLTGERHCASGEVVQIQK